MALTNENVRKIVSLVVDHGSPTSHAAEKFGVIFQELVPDIDGIVRQFQ